MIYLLRHGLDDEKYIGGYSNVELTSEGIKQVQDVTLYLEQNDFQFEKIISSDVLRAKQTAGIVSNRLNLKVYYSSILRELDKGKMNGMLATLAYQKYPDYKDLNDIYMRYPDGESMIDLYNRVQKNIDKILEMDNCLIVTHRGIINMLYYILNDLQVDMDKKRFDVTHASLHELDIQSKKIKRIR